MEMKTNTKLSFSRALLYTEFIFFLSTAQITKMELDCKLEKIGRRSVKFGRHIFQTPHNFNVDSFSQQNSFDILFLV